MPGIGELLIILLILLVVFGASRLPALGDGLGRALGSFRRGARGEGPDELPPGR